jgi:hypothetical protein
LLTAYTSCSLISPEYPSSFMVVALKARQLCK